MTTLTFKVSSDEARRIRALARREKITVSELLRRKAAASAPVVVAKVRRVYCRQTGARVFAGVPGQPPLTTEGVRAMMSEFP